MSDVDWTTHPKPPAASLPDLEHTAEVAGLKVTVTESGSYGLARWRVEGFLDDIEVQAHDYYSRKDVDQVKAAASRAAHRMYEAGIRGEKAQPSEEGA